MEKKESKSIARRATKKKKKCVLLNNTITRKTIVQLSTLRARATNRILFRNTNSEIGNFQNQTRRVLRHIEKKTPENKYATLLIYALIFKNAQH